MLTCLRSDLGSAVDAVFRWFVTTEEFGSQHLGVFIAAILQDAIAQGVMTADSYRVVTRIIHEIPSAEVGYTEKVNLMRSIVLAALDSSG